MTNQRYIQAVAAAMDEEMERDDQVVVFGLDARSAIMGTTAGLLDKYGPKRVIDVPLSEAGFTGLGVGAAIMGMRPVIEYQINTLQYVGMDQLVNQAAKLRYMTGGQIKIPLVVRVLGVGPAQGQAAQHSDSPYAQLVHMGLKVAVPSSAADAKGLIKTAIRDDDPVVLFEPARLYGQRDEVPDEPDFLIPLGKARTVREGSDVTVVAIGHTVQEALAAAEEVAADDVSVEVIDPRSLLPFDYQSVLDSVQRTGRLVVVDDGFRMCGFAAEVASVVAEDAFDALQAPIIRIARAHVPTPYNPALERKCLANRAVIARAIKRLA